MQLLNLRVVVGCLHVALEDAPIARMMARLVTKRVAAVGLDHHQAQLVLGCLHAALEDAPTARMMARLVTKRAAAVGQGRAHPVPAHQVRLEGQHIAQTLRVIFRLIMEARSGRPVVGPSMAAPVRVQKRLSTLQVVSWSSTWSCRGRMVM